MTPPRWGAIHDPITTSNEEEEVLVEMIGYFSRIERTTRSEKNPGAGRPAVFNKFDPKEHRTIHIKADGPWTLTGKELERKITLDPTPEFFIPLPAGEYTFDFPPASENLSLIIIDPDPGGGEPG